MQLIYRWTKNLDPRLRKGLWTPEEDTVGVGAGGPSPRKATWTLWRPLGGLSGVVITAETHLSVSFLQKLLQAVAKYGEHDWCKIREEVPGRSDTQCRERWVRPAGAAAWVGEEAWGPGETPWEVGQPFNFEAAAYSDCR